MYAQIVKYKKQLARGLVFFLELTHLIIAKNREILLQHLSKVGKGESPHDGAPFGGSMGGGARVAGGSGRYFEPIGGSMKAGFSSLIHPMMGGETEGGAAGGGTGGGGGGGTMDSRTSDCSEGVAGGTGGGGGGGGGRTEALRSAIGVQSELQRSFSSNAKALYPLLVRWIGDETPAWINLCSAEFFQGGSFACSSTKYIFSGSRNQGFR